MLYANIINIFFIVVDFIDWSKSLNIFLHSDWFSHSILTETILFGVLYI